MLVVIRAPGLGYVVYVLVAIRTKPHGRIKGHAVRGGFKRKAGYSTPLVSQLQGDKGPRKVMVQGTAACRYRSV